MSIERLTAEQVRRCLRGVAYEIFVQSFFDSNSDGIDDLNGLRQKLDYLSDLGVTLIWLMPIHPAKTYHKYDVEDYTSVHPDYGTLDDVRQLVAECHQRGILVILDLVANHTSYDHPWFRQAQLDPTNAYRDYYIWTDSARVRRLGMAAFDTPDRNAAGLWHRVGPESEHFDWEEFERRPKARARGTKDEQGNSVATYYAVFDPRMPDLNYECVGVQDEMCRIGQTWLELGVDGFRLDAAKYFHKPPQLQSNLAWWMKFRQAMSRVNPSVYLIGEVWDLASRIAPYLRSLDSVFNFELADLLVSCVDNEGSGSALLNSYVRIQNIYQRESHGQFLDAIFLSNHDQTRVMSRFDNDLSKAKIAAALLLTLPGLPFIYYGEEIGMLGMKPPDKYCREPFLWSASHTEGQTTWLEPRYTTSVNGCIPLDEQLADPESLVNHYKRLIHARCQSDVLLFGSLKPVTTRVRSICLFEREYNGQTVCVAHNLGYRTQRVNLPSSYEHVLLSTNSASRMMKKGELSLEGYSSMIIE